MNTAIKDLSQLLTAKPLRELDIERIKKNIPHRYPFLFVDKVKIIEDKKYGVGIKNVNANEPYFKGHFPQKPIMPGVLILETMAQTCAAMMMEYPEYKNKIAFFMGIEKAKFRRAVVPGDKLEIACEILRHGAMGKCKFNAYISGQLCAEAQLSFIMEG
jgi:3-hydroxyacyl-[acyl-carrier-protein] dehydratase